jgi:hypothetical protein
MARLSSRPLHAAAAFVLVASVLSLGMARAQPPRPDPGPQIAAMSKLDYMVGEWQGEGWMDMGGHRETFRGGERVQKKLGGVALLVEGEFLGKRPGSDAEVPVHTTLGVISWNPQSQKHEFKTWLATGISGQYELELQENGWSWRITTPRGIIRYTMTRTPEGEWFEIGERTADEKSWEKFFEMRLKKKA